MIDETAQRIAARVEQRLERLFASGGALTPSGIFPAPGGSLILDQVRALTLRAGKRVRPTLLVCGAAMLAEDAVDDPDVIDAATALELLHSYFLIHDDIMDDDDTRRGGPSVHKALEPLARDPKRARDLAILAGDLAVALHEGLLAGLSAPAEHRAAAARIFAEMHLDVVHGQTLDLLGTADPEEVALRKTASYTTVGPLTAGAALAGAGPDELARLAAIARPIGVAFQLRDDLLGAFGDPAITGKPVGTDIRRGKRTFLIAQAETRADDDERRAIDTALGHEQASDDAVEAATQALISCGARQACEERAVLLVEGALHALEAETFREEGRQLLAELTCFLAGRDT